MSSYAEPTESTSRFSKTNLNSILPYIMLLSVAFAAGLRSGLPKETPTVQVCNLHPITYAVRVNCILLSNGQYPSL